MKQVKVLDDVNLMLEEIVKHEKDNGKVSVNKQSVVNDLIIAKFKRINKS